MEGMVAGWTETYRKGAQHLKTHVQDNGNLFNATKMYIYVCNLYVMVMFLRIRMIVE